MTENNTNKDTSKILFINLITMLSISVMQQLGKIINPVTGKTEMNLEAAQATIDTLDMLFAKTRGNLDADEERLMKDTLASLKMNFVETSEERQKAEAKGQKSEVRDQKSVEAEEPKNKPEDSKAHATTDDKTETKDPKFHKSYN